MHVSTQGCCAHCVRNMCANVSSLVGVGPACAAPALVYTLASAPGMATYSPLPHPTVHCVCLYVSLLHTTSRARLFTKLQHTSTEMCGLDALSVSAHNSMLVPAQHCIHTQAPHAPPTMSNACCTMLWVSCKLLCFNAVVKRCVRTSTGVSGCPVAWMSLTSGAPAGAVSLVMLGDCFRSDPDDAARCMCS